MLMYSKKYPKAFPQVAYFSVVFLIITICFSVLTTVKFATYWYYAVLFGFLNVIYRDIKEKTMKNKFPQLST
jgi:hypothetical protein